MDTYKIVRFYLHKRGRIIKRGLTLEQARAHCQKDETSSTTATSRNAKLRTKLYGAWFDGYEKE